MRIVPQPMLLTPAAAPADRRMRATAESFEAQFVKSMLEQTMTGLSGEGPLGGAGAGAETWRSFLIEEHARAIVSKGGFGIAAQVYKAMQAATQGAPHAGA